jgi:hypothetical protein
MPISQERFIVVVTGAKQLITFHRELKHIVKEGLKQDLAEVNSVLEHSKEPALQEAMGLLVGRISRILDAFDSADNFVNEQLIAAVLVEEKHFAQKRESNRRAAFKQEQTRREMGIVPRAKTVALAEAPKNIKPVTSLEEPVQSLDDIENSPGFKAFQEQMQRKWNGDAPTSAPNDSALVDSVPDTAQALLAKLATMVDLPTTAPNLEG